jgi:iron complex transport system substrate-binding protein
MTKRIVSLLPSATEIVCALGFADWLVGRSHECDYPAVVRNLPVCTKPRLKVDGDSGEIDREVKALLRDALSIYELRTETIRALKADLILTQAQCEVCAVSLPEVQAAVNEWADSQPEILSLSPRRLADVWENIESVAEALGAKERGTELVTKLQGRIESVRQSPIAAGPTVACLEWLDPLMAAGNWVPELVALAGGRDVFGAVGKHSDWIEWDALRQGDPEIIILTPCGFDLERTRREASVLFQKAGWAQLRAVKSGHVFLTDGNQFFNRPGPRLVESLEILVEILHPDECDFARRGNGWELMRDRVQT